MLTLIMGGSGSGKSAYAEDCMTALGDSCVKYYLATMQVFDEEGRVKIARHQSLRSGKGFLTIEQPVSIQKAAEKMQPSCGKRAALLECMSNLVANEMFGAQVPHSYKDVTETVLEGIRQLQEEVTELVIVTNNVFEDGIRYDDTTLQYMQALGMVNIGLTAIADKVVEVVVGIPVVIKDTVGKG